MNPLPKSASALAVVVAVLSALNSAGVLNVLSPKVAAVLALAATLVAAISKALHEDKPA